MYPDDDRRSFLSLAIFGIGAVFSAVIGVPIVAYALDPLNRKGSKSSFKVVEGVKLDELGAAPKQGLVRDIRLDGWNLHPADVIGRVWVVKAGAAPAGLTTKDAVVAFNRDAARKTAYLTVFTTICPHLGCSINVDSAGAGFACPCHNATYHLDGLRAAEGNPALRGMDTLDWVIDTDDPDFNRIKVEYKNFTTSIAEKKPIG